MPIKTRPLKICLLSYRSNPHCGGQGVYLKNLSRALKDLGHRVDQLGLALRRHGIRAESKGVAFEVTDRTREAVKRILPFPLTGAQKRVIREIRKDIGSGRQMNRLLQGDVGSGKTLVALAAMLLAVEAGYQAAVMAPTQKSRLAVTNPSTSVCSRRLGSFAPLNASAGRSATVR